MAFLPRTRQVAASIGYCRACLASELNGGGGGAVSR